MYFRNSTKAKTISGDPAVSFINNNEIDVEDKFKSNILLQIILGLVLLLGMVGTVIGIAIMHQTILSLYVYPKVKDDLFESATQLSKKLKLPLLVVGDPYSGTVDQIYGAAYSCGDVCIDLTGCPKCDQGLVVDLNHSYEEINEIDSVLDKLRSKGPYVIFVSHTLDYVENLQGAYLSLLSLTESYEHIFIFHGQESWSSMVPYNYIQRNILETAPPSSACIKFRSANVLQRWRTPAISYGNICPKIHNYYQNIRN